MNSLTLHQIIALKKGASAEALKAKSALHHTSQKPESYSGVTKTYTPKDAEGQELPPENKLVEQRVDSVFAALKKVMSPTMDLQASLDRGNTLAKADVVVEGTKIMVDVPVTYLLFLEKELVDIRTFVSKIPTLDPARSWTTDPNTDLYKSEPVLTFRTNKVQRPVVLSQAMIKDGIGIPANVQLVTTDEVAGSWLTTYFSGAISSSDKVKILDRVDTLLSAVKTARMEANAIVVPSAAPPSAAIFSYIFDGQR